MAEGNGAAPAITPEAFKGSFAALQGLILAEWPSVEKDALAATEGELEKVIALVSAKTEHTRTLVTKQLTELQMVALKDAPAPRAPRVNAMLDKLEKKTAELVKELRGTVIEEARTKARENLLVTLLVALGLGLLAGLIFGGLGRGHK